MTQTINIYEWDLSYSELIEWATETKSDVHALTRNSNNITDSMYVFENDEDYIAFLLKFRQKRKGGMAAGYFCPYIPLK